MNEKTIRNIAGMCFATYGALWIIGTISNGLGFTSISSIIFAISAFLLSFGAFAKNDALAIAGAAANELAAIITAISAIEFLYLPHIYEIIVTCSIGILIILAVSTKGATGKICCFIAASLKLSVLIVGYLGTYYLYRVLGSPLGIMLPRNPFRFGPEALAWDTLSSLLIVAGISLLGIATSANKEKKQTQKKLAARSNQIDRLTKIAELRDKGILTPEEFEEKKQEILR